MHRVPRNAKCGKCGLFICMPCRSPAGHAWQIDPIYFLRKAAIIRMATKSHPKFRTLRISTHPWGKDSRRSNNRSVPENEKTLARVPLSSTHPLTVSAIYEEEKQTVFSSWPSSGVLWWADSKGSGETREREVLGCCKRSPRWELWGGGLPYGLQTCIS